MENGWIVIGIGGATCSGKTTIANELHNKLPESMLIHQDDYFHPVGSPKLEYIDEVQHYNWDKLSAIDTDRMVDDVHRIIQSQATKGKLILLVEGHLIFNIAPIAELCSKKYFMTVSKEVGRLRRSTRRYKRYDARYFDKYAWPLYEYYRKNAFDTFTDLVVLNGDLDLKVNESRILSDVSALCKSFECIVCGGIVFTFYFQYYCTLPWLEIFDIGNKTDNICVLIIEGTLVLNDTRLQNLCTLKYYLTLPYEISRERRHQKAYEIPDPPMNFDRVVWPQYLKYKSELHDPSISFIDSHENDITAILHQILRGISRLCLHIDD